MGRNGLALRRAFVPATRQPVQFYPKLLKVRAPLAMAAIAALTSFSPVGAAHAATSGPASQSLASQIAAAYNAPSGVQVRKGLARSFTDSALPSAARDILNAYGPTGANTLSTFQVDLLNGLIAEAGGASIIAAELTGETLTSTQKAQAARLRALLMKNPAITAIRAAGARLATSPELPADIAAVVKSDVATTKLSPMSTHTPAVDTVIGGLANLRNTSYFKALARQLAPLLKNAAFPALLKTENPMVLATFLPPATLIGLSASADHSSIRSPVPADLTSGQKTALVEIGGAVAGIGAVVAGLLGAPVVAAGLAITAGVAGVVVGVRHFVCTPGQAPARKLLRRAPSASGR